MTSSQWVTWDKDAYPLCSICQRSSIPFFSPYKKGIERIYRFTTPKGKIPVLAECMWGHEFNAFIPVEWADKVQDPNDVLKEWIITK